jgi:hypothetical protein
MKQSIAQFADSSIANLDTVLGGKSCRKSKKSKSSKSRSCRRSSKSKKTKKSSRSRNRGCTPPPCWTPCC